MKNKSILIVLFLFAIFISSCDNDGILEPQSDKIDGMIPLKVGFKWTWNVISYDENGSIKQSHQYYVEVVKDTIINEEYWFLLREMDSPSSYPMTNRDGVTYSYYAGQPTVTFNTIIEDTTISSTNSNRSYLVSKNNLIQCPLGEFNCNLYQVFMNINDKKLLEANYYLEHNKGIIRTETFSYKLDGSSYVAVTTELVSTNAF